MQNPADAFAPVHGDNIIEQRRNDENAEYNKQGIAQKGILKLIEVVKDKDSGNSATCAVQTNAQKPNQTMTALKYRRCTERVK
ncbi:hypothetical protein [Marispirochaeta sp.]|uniref:hypothetical protein n=1 Tax=Marispirochaeta sp. TaxID=2038653 RepID=UPI0029C6E53B|nr:hypothetical protein [Marispirochaeta sp.]